jgi:7-cyano-7-deazaguanine synthase in queuosine biosynthesis
MINIEIPKTTPLGKNIERIGVWLSGGADSAAMCYLLAKQIKENNLPVKLVTLTVDYKRPFQNIACKVRDKIIELLDCEDVFLEHHVYNPPEGITWTPEELKEQFHIRNIENFRNNRVHMLYSAITTNPPRDVQETFNEGIKEDVERVRGENVEKETIRYFEKDGGEFLEIKPFFKINKKMVFELYKENNLLDTLFPLTRSCEKLNTYIGHCGRCWWCQERQWAFGRLE